MLNYNTLVLDYITLRVRKDIWGSIVLVHFLNPSSDDSCSCPLIPPLWGCCSYALIREGGLSCSAYLKVWWCWWRRVLALLTLLLKVHCSYAPLVIVLSIWGGGWVGLRQRKNTRSGFREKIWETVIIHHNSCFLNDGTWICRYLSLTRMSMWVFFSSSSREHCNNLFSSSIASCICCMVGAGFCNCGERG